MKISNFSVLDDLNLSSRELYERSKLKLSISLILFAAFFVMLGLTCQFGGNSAYNHQMLYISTLTDDMIYNLNHIESGFSMSTFLCFVGSIILLIGFVCSNPFICGTKNEKIALSDPQKLDDINPSTPESTYSPPELVKNILH